MTVSASFPLSFKGPLGQLQRYFSEHQIYRALNFLNQDNIIEFQFNRDSQLAKIVFIDSEQGFKTVNTCLKWPPKNSISGTCDCQHSDCVHLAALALHCKVKLEAVAPGIGQIRQQQDLITTFAEWIQRQEHDPFPNMARHRVVYILDYDQDNKQFFLTLHKAYLSKQEQLQIKADVSNSLLNQKQPPKFISLSDKKAFYLMQQSGFHDVHRIPLGDDSSCLKLLQTIIATKRCFWRACYRPPLQFETVDFLTFKRLSADSKALFSGCLFSLQHNMLIRLKKPSSKATAKSLTGKIKPILKIKTHSFQFPWEPHQGGDLDIAHILFEHQQGIFSTEDLSSEQWQVKPDILRQVAYYSYQVERIPSVTACFEPPISEHFSINDRYLEGEFCDWAALLHGLQNAGWRLKFDQTFRLRQKLQTNWYAQLNHRADKEQSWFDLELGVKIDGKTVNLLPQLVNAIQSGQLKQLKERLTLPLGNGENIGVEHQKVKQIATVLTELYDPDALQDQQLHFPSNQSLRLSQLDNLWASTTTKAETQSTALTWQGDTWLKDKAESLKNIKQLDKVNPPDALVAELRPYQQTGLAWLQFLSKNQLGGILADDMGLGKTLQTIAHILLQKQTGLMNRPCLVVTPTSLIGNWLAECQRFAPSLKTIALIGKTRVNLFNKIQHFDVVITSYGTLLRDIEVLSRQSFHLHILDEAQAIKNSKAKISKTVRSINSELRLCLSGTPIENHLGELWSLVEFLLPGFLGSEKQFQKIYQQPIEKQHDQERLNDLRNRLSAVILRRKKSQVAKELPSKNEIIEHIELDEMQANFYESVRLSMAKEMQQLSKGKQINRILLGNALLRLRQICCHPALLDIDGSKQLNSAKLNWLRTVLPEMLAEGRRVLLFSSFTSMLALISEMLDELKIKHLKLTGQSSANARSQMIEQFQNQATAVFLISLKAGGAGINLTAADTVIHFDPWWNPAAEQQASDRAHRIGQDKKVFVYKLITKGTVEEKIHQLQKHKQQLADDMLQQNSFIQQILSTAQWQEMFEPIG